MSSSKEGIQEDGYGVTPSSTQLYSLPPNQAAVEVAAGYSYQEWLINQERISSRWLSKALDLLGTTLGTAGDVLAMESSPTPQSVSQTLIFRNDANIILIPHGGIGMPTGHQFSESPGPIFPGEVARLRIVFNPQFANASIVQVIRFAIITTDPQIIARRPSNQIRALNMQLSFSRDGRLHLSSVNAGTNLFVPRINFQYVGYRGQASSTLPSFGICMTTVEPANQSGHTMGSTITFTPLGLRF
ncbi:hypothetical protein [Serratia ureilytica]|uniref:hypothetical protein n=1 Tax=Serratia TaxID=613 RepID=UPI00235DFC74|nr:hypothetical protein [Serratia ureilytica]